MKFHTFVLTVVLTWSGAPAHAQKIIIGDTSPIAAAWPVMVAEDFGYFKEQGLEPEFFYTGNNAAVIQQVVGGSLDIGVSTIETTIRAIDNGAKIKIVGSEMLKYPYSIVAPASVKNARDLIGKKIILALPKSAPTIYWNKWIKEQGIDPASIDQVYDGATPNRFAALQSGTVQAALLTQPFDQMAVVKGNSILLDLGTYASKHGFTVFVASEKYIGEKPEMIRKLMRAVGKSISTIYDATQKERVIVALTRRIKIDPETAERTYQYFTSDLKPFALRGDVSTEFIAAVSSMLRDEGELKQSFDAPDKIFTREFLPD